MISIVTLFLSLKCVGDISMRISNKIEDAAFYALVFYTFKIIWQLTVLAIMLGVSVVIFIFEFIKINFIKKM